VVEISLNLEEVGFQDLVEVMGFFRENKIIEFTHYKKEFLLIEGTLQLIYQIFIENDTLVYAFEARSVYKPHSVE
jgi:hypothetical protein